MRGVWEHSQLSARGRWTEVDSPKGVLPALLPPGTWSERPRMDPIPALGEHTDAILTELGYASHEIATMHAEGVV